MKDYIIIGIICGTVLSGIHMFTSRPAVIREAVPPVNISTNTFILMNATGEWQPGYIHTPDQTNFFAVSVRPLTLNGQLTLQWRTNFLDSLTNKTEAPDA